MKGIMNILVILIIIITIGFNFSIYSYGEDIIEETELIELKNNQVALEDNIQIIINTNQIKYQKSKIKITANINITNIEAEYDNNLEIDESKNEVVLEIDKQNTDLEQVILNFKMIDEIEVGDVISINIEIINLDNEEEKEVITKEVTIIDKDEENDDIKSKQEEKNDVKDVKQKEDTELKSNTQITDVTKLDEKTDKENRANEINSNDQNVNVQTVSTTVSKSTSSKEQTIVYNGSDNNYLKIISIEGYTLNEEFSKDNETYFLTVEENDEYININTEAEDLNAKVSIYGNDNLKTGTNKIIITVTAENGNTRTYRIFVTK